MLRRFLNAGLVTSALVAASGCSQEAAPEPTAAASVTPAAQASTTPTASETAPFPEGATPSMEQLLDDAKQAVEKGNAQSALDKLNAAIRANPTSPQPLLQRADLLTAADHKAQAILDLTAALALEPQNARTLNTRGYLKMSQGDLPGAMEDFTAAVGIDLSYPQPYNNRGLVRISEGAAEKALHDFDAALRIDPNYIDAHNNRGYTLMLLKRHEEAVATLTRAIELDPRYVNAWNNRGLTLKELGRFEEACADFTQAIELQPSNSKYYLHRSEALTALGRTDESRSDVEHVVWMERLAIVNRRVTAAPNDARGWLERADHMRQGKRFDAALSDVKTAIQLLGAGQPAASDAYVLQARVLLEQGHVEQAIESANVALQGGPNEQASSVRGDAYFQLQKFEAAVEDYKLARRLDPLVRQAYEMRAKELETSGEIEQAGYFREQAGQLAPEKLTQTAASDVEAPPFPIDVTEPAPIQETPAPR
jgi:tetratricopeptide (TPR) repeat protein